MKNRRTSGPRGLAVDASSVYWTNSATGNVVKVALTGGSPVTLASGQSEPWGIAVDATSVYWATNVNPGTIMKVPLGGGSPVTLASGQNPMGVAIDCPITSSCSTTNIWTNVLPGAVMKVSRSGGSPITLASGLNTPYRIAVDTYNPTVYWRMARPARL